MTTARGTIGFIGGGHMATAIIRGLLRAGQAPGAILVSEPDAGRRAALAGMEAGLRVGGNNAAVAAACDVLVLAVKPQVMAAVAGALKAVPRPSGQLVMSVAAGITLASLRDWLGSERLVRVMPNQPALVGAGVSALVAAPGVGEADRERAAWIAGATGTALWLGDEGLMDAVTAVSGSGPAYFYLLMELMETTAAELGLPADLARRLVRATALGAARVVEETGTDPPELRAAVTSPGGTTAAALGVFAGADLAGIVRRALLAARDRSAELGGATAAGRS